MMNNQMIQIGYDIKKMPLGRLSKEHIMKGYNILEAIMLEIKGKNEKKKLEYLSNDFYSTIPHDFGFSNMSLFTLVKEQNVKQKIEML
jgi:poly [ADP-ribose] polymerase